MTEAERGEARNRLARRLLAADQAERQNEALRDELDRLMKGLNEAYDRASKLQTQNADLKRQLEAAEDTIASVRINSEARHLRARNRELTAELLRTQKLWNTERLRANALEAQNGQVAA